MHCFYHQTTDAVGVCKSCGKGVCPDCAVDLDKGIACRGHCEDEVLAIIQLVDRNVRMAPVSAGLIQEAGKVRITSALFSIIFGMVMAGYGLFSDRQLHFLTAGGACLLVYGVLQWVSARKISGRTSGAGQDVAG